MASYSSSTLSLVLAWIFSIGFLSVLIMSPFQAVALIGACFFEERQRILKAFLVVVALLCLVFISPAPYLVFLVTLAAAYPVQSLYAFGTSIFPLSLYVPVVFAALAFVGIWAPFWLALLIVGGFSNEGRINPWRALVAAVAMPILCTVASLVFLLLLDVAGFTTSWLRTRDVIRATNGPAALVFRYVTLPLYLAPHGIADSEKNSPDDILRIHVATQYLSSDKAAAFLKRQYPLTYTNLSRQPE